MIDREKVINGLEHCLSRYVDGLCDDCPYMGELDKSYMVPMKCKEIIMRDALDMLKEQEETIRNREQEIRDKNERLKERAEQLDSMLKEKETVEPICIKKDFVDEFYGYVASCPKCKTLWIMYQDEKMHYCPNCGRSVKWE